eukprot:CAMPEP_0117667206 /NCGR_PEP_ID=MMETSP0804-20121206/10828_1 /TAXON_ID=1074897 /ORGANISM="Tetraselmis astigmatica, Strain CCMP880" /LENGTH=277 /DNA_ID=CAMNT_0005474887 /DNA_START=118 /DNA_END=951 /DNA_ORIENTATION=+
MSLAARASKTPQQSRSQFRHHAIRGSGLSGLRVPKVPKSLGSPSRRGFLTVQPPARQRCSPLAAAAVAPGPAAPQEEDAFLNRLLWDSIKKPLMSVGQKGVEESHGNSLRELLNAHSVVKVKFTSSDPAVEQLEHLASAADACFLQQKGRTVMFAKAGAEPQTLLSTGAKNLKRQQGRADHRALQQQKRQEGVPELDPIIVRALSTLENSKTGKTQWKMIDKEALWALADLPSAEARQMVAEKLSPRATRDVTNMSAWITSACNRVMKELYSFDSKQ